MNVRTPYLIVLAVGLVVGTLATVAAILVLRWIGPLSTGSAPTGQLEPSNGAVSTIGGTNVPFNLHCQEDEVIAFAGVDTLTCVHIDTLAGR